MIVRQGARLSCAYCATGPASSSTLVSPSFGGPATVQSSTEQSRLRGSPVSPNPDLRRTRRTFSTSRSSLARPVRDPYKVLSLHKTATKQQIKAKFYEVSARREVILTRPRLMLPQLTPLSYRRRPIRTLRAAVPTNSIRSARHTTCSVTIASGELLPIRHLQFLLSTVYELNS